MRIPEAEYIYGLGGSKSLIRRIGLYRNPDSTICESPNDEMECTTESEFYFGYALQLRLS